jgi:hypothetical protein
MRTSVASNIKPGTCLAVPLHEAVTPPLDRPVRGYIEIVYPAERSGLTGRVSFGKKGGFELLAVSSPMPGVGHYGIATA